MATKTTGRLAMVGGLMLVLGLLVGCTEPDVSPPPTATAGATGSTVPSPPLPTASPSSTGTGAATPPVVLPSPSSTPSRPAPGQGAPTGYAQSCAKDVPWGVQVSQPFLCLDGPTPGARVARGAAVTVRGWAGGSFENNVVLELWSLEDRQPKARLVQVPVTYDALDLGMPGGFERAITVPATAPSGPMRITAHFDSPRDGAVVRSASVDIVVE